MQKSKKKITTVQPKLMFCQNDTYSGNVSFLGPTFEYWQVSVVITNYNSNYNQQQQFSLPITAIFP